jgi:lipoprotein-anchoring transpeptidase ErfK/SrfK
LFARLVKAIAGIAALRCARLANAFRQIGMVADLVTPFIKDASLTVPWLAESLQIWPVTSVESIFLLGETMIRFFAAPIAAIALLSATAGGAFAEEFDSRDIMGGGPNFFRGGSSPVPRTTVMYNGNYAPGTIVVNTSERRLYLVLQNGQALRYGIGVGRDGFRWGGVHRITAKKEWPDWTPPSQMLARRPDLPRHMKGGVENPLGARAMYLGSTLYRIHGSNEPETIGQAVSSGCFRMTNDDVTDLYGRVGVGTTVVVLNN